MNSIDDSSSAASTSTAASSKSKRRSIMPDTYKNAAPYSPSRRAKNGSVSVASESLSVKSNMSSRAYRIIDSNGVPTEIVHLGKDQQPRSPSKDLNGGTKQEDSKNANGSKHTSKPRNRVQNHVEPSSPNKDKQVLRTTRNLNRSKENEKQWNKKTSIEALHNNITSSTRGLNISVSELPQDVTYSEEKIQVNVGATTEKDDGAGTPDTEAFSPIDIDHQRSTAKSSGSRSRKLQAASHNKTPSFKLVDDPSPSSPAQSPGASQKKISIEKRLFHQLHSHKVHNPSLKEFNESWAFCNAVRSYFGKDKHKPYDFDIVIDVAGGHGALAALFLILTSAHRAVVVDPADVGKGGVERAWGDFYRGPQQQKQQGENKKKLNNGNVNNAQPKELVYRYECLRTGLVDELDRAIRVDKINPQRILVVACHACQHLSDETMEIACSYGVHAAVMPCCQKDLTGGSWKAAGKSLDIGVAPLMDVLIAGKAMSWNNGRHLGVTYEVRMKTIDKKITPQNRIILCRAVKDEGGNEDESGESPSSLKMKAKVAAAHEKLERAYRKAHSKPNLGNEQKKGVLSIVYWKNRFCYKSAAIGLLAGLAVSKLSRTRK